MHTIDGHQLAGREWIVENDGGFDSPTLTVMHRGPEGYLSCDPFMHEYAMKLSFGEPLRGKLPGKIHLTKSTEPDVDIAGTFTLDVGSDLAQPPESWERPWALSKIEFPDDDQHHLAVGYVGRTSAGKWHSDAAQAVLAPGHVRRESSNKYDPRATTIGRNEKLGMYGRHVRLEPGRYLFYVREGDRHIAWQVADIGEESQLEWTFDVDPSQSGSLVVSSPRRGNGHLVQIVPLNSEGEPPFEVTEWLDRRRLAQLYGDPKLEGGEVVVDGLAPGKYRVFIGNESTDTEVEPGKETPITIGGWPSAQ